MDVSGDGGVVKTVTRAAPEGAAGVSAEAPIAEVRYEGRLQSTGHIFDSSKVDNTVFSFTPGEGKAIRGWELAVPTMRVGETCTLVVEARYAYGDEGSSPDIPPGATLVFEMELVGVKAPKAVAKGVSVDVGELRARQAARADESTARAEAQRKRVEAKAAAAARLANKGQKGQKKKR